MWTASILTDRGMCKALRQVIASQMADGACRVSAHEANSLVMEIPRVLTAVIALASTGVPEAVHVAVMSPAEVASGRSHWAGSHHQVFRCDSSSWVNAHHSVMHLLASQGMPIAGAQNPLSLHTAMLAACCESRAPFVEDVSLRAQVVVHAKRNLLSAKIYIGPV